MTVALLTAVMSIGDIRNYNYLHKMQVALYYNWLQQYQEIASSDSDIHGLLPKLDTWKAVLLAFFHHYISYLFVFW